MASSLRVLIVEDRPADAELMLHELRAAGFEPQWQRVECEQDYLVQLEQRPDIILCDYSMPRFHVYRALDLLQGCGFDIPFIVVSGTITEEAAVECLKRGADDYLLKDRLARLGRAVVRALQDGKDRAAAREGEAALRASEELFRLLAENSRDVLYRYRIVSPAGFEYVSPAAATMSGYEPQEFYSDPCFGSKLVHPDDRGLLSQAVANFTGQPLVLRWVRKDGTVIWTEHLSSEIRDGGGVPVAVECSVRDISERKRAEQELLETHGILEAVVQGSPLAIVLLDTQKSVRSWNPAAERLFGWCQSEVMGSPTPIIPESDIAEADLKFDRVVRGATIAGLERRRLRKDGTLVDVLIAASPVQDISGQTVGLVTIYSDISERNRLQEQLLRAQRLEAAGQIASQVAHDFNNLLSPLVAYPELIKMRLPDGHPAADLCDSMMEASKQIAEINDEMLALGRRAGAVHEAVDLNRLLRQAVGECVDPGKGLELSMELAGSLLPVKGTPAQLMRVISNLLANAQDAMPGGGLLRIKTENCYLDRPINRYNRVEIGEYVKLSVVDSGSGIPLHVRDKIFDAFFTTKRTDRKRGTGLGLSVVQAVLGDHKGYIDLESDVGKGTAFYVYLPTSREPVKVEKPDPLPRGCETILVVDDNRHHRGAVVQQLLFLGYRVEAAAGGEEALAYLEEHEVDLMVLDMIMPPGIDGAETYRQIREKRPGQRAILCSGYADLELISRAQQLGAGPHLRKPIPLGKLAGAVRGELDRT